MFQQAFSIIKKIKLHYFLNEYFADYAYRIDGPFPSTHLVASMYDRIVVPVMKSTWTEGLLNDKATSLVGN